MKKTEISIKVWSIYLFVLGLFMIIFPAMTVGWFGYNSEGETWIRMIGILSVVLAMYYMQMARYHLYVLYNWKIVGHTFGITCMSTFLVLGIADSRIVGTIAVELLACLWTAFALKSDKKSAKAEINTGAREFVKQAS